MTTPNPEPCVEAVQHPDTAGGSTDGWEPGPDGLGWVRAPRNNRRPYKADIRGLAEAELARAADRIAELRRMFDDSEQQTTDCLACLADARTQRNRWRIACLVVALLAVIGWLL